MWQTPISGVNIRSKWLEWESDFTRLMGEYYRFRLEYSTRTSSTLFAAYCNGSHLWKFCAGVRRSSTLVLALFAECFHWFIRGVIF